MRAQSLKRKRAESKLNRRMKRAGPDFSTNKKRAKNVIISGKVSEWTSKEKIIKNSYEEKKNKIKNIMIIINSIYIASHFKRDLK